MGCLGWLLKGCLGQVDALQMLPFRSLHYPVFIILLARDKTREGDGESWHLGLEKETATHSSVLAWRIPGTGEPGGLPSMGSHRVGHD